MAVRRTSLLVRVVGVVGVALIVGAMLVRFVVAPAVSTLPSNTDLSIQYAGTGTLLNPAALQGGDSAPVLATGVPITIDRHIKVTSTHGNVAVVADDLTLKAGTTTLPNDHVYALDRKSLDAVRPPSAVTADPAHGLTIAFPLSPKANDSYHYYDPASQLTVSVKYAGKANRGGRAVYQYTATAAGPLKDPNLLKALPTALPKATFVSRPASGP